ncbi:MAG: heparin lyase I family protein [Rhodobacter sp.]|uniref:heparin lyase I family protein n=1 Tax=Pararhodobacter sp. TaxID=2127056 RepID=UPI001D8B211D|nr:heparin lyase I family protein [Pararhodobacter sp.]MCB1344792.1 heparin lyase I family protein [Paracoccaceae bacterium]MCC0072648.1 heparin lyase I family protein [Rhodobacter sp.]HPD93280.1 heparin lyase I family protein [Pararhodobacter sp.]
MVRRFVLMTLVAVALPGLAGAQRLPGARSLSDTPWGYGIVSGPARAGAQAQRFELRAGDCAANTGGDDCARDRERTEFRPDFEWPPGQTVWIGLSILLPAGFPVSDRVNTTLVQIHQRGGPERRAGGRVSHPPVMQIEARGDWLSVTVHVPDAPNIHHRLMRLESMRGGWHDLAIGFDSREPRLSIWIDGQERADIAAWDAPLPEVYYLKYGLYRSFVSRHGGPMATQIAWFDEVRLGPSRAAVAVDPSDPVD